VSGGLISPIKIWDSSTGIELRRFRINPTNSGVQNAFASSPNGALLAVATDQAIFVWDRRTGLIVHQLDRVKTRVRTIDLAFSPDSRILATLSSDLESSEGEIEFLDVATGKRLAQLRLEALKRNRPSTGSVVFSPNGKLFAVCFG